MTARLSSQRALMALVMYVVAAAAAAATIEEKSFESQFRSRSYSSYVPNSVSDPVSDRAAVPLLIVLHGSYGRASKMLEHWTDMAERHRFVAVAPHSKDPTKWQLHQDPPVMFRDLVTAVAAERNIDTRRIYLFGHSAGAVYALTLAMMESRFFAASAIHAGAWRSRAEYVALQFAVRKIPVMLIVGDRDRYFSVHDVRRTEEALREASHDTQLSILRRHDHDYGDVADEVNTAAWSFLHEKLAPDPPIFQRYD